MRSAVVIFLCILSLQVYAQERRPLNGRVTSEGSGIESVHVSNVTTNRHSVTDREGNFMLNSRIGDTLFFSHVSMVELVRVVSKADIETGSVMIRMLKRDNKLEEVHLGEHPEINAVSLGIVSKKAKQFSTYERRLETAGDFKPIHLLSLLGGSLEIDPILNAISGRTKKIKNNIVIEKKISNIHLLKNNYYDYMIKEMELSEEESDMFISFLVEQESLQAALDTQNENRITFFLHDEWLKFQALRFSGTESQGE